MMQPDRQERQPAAQPGPPPPRRARYLARARDRFEGSLAQSFLQRLGALDFADQAVLFGAGLLVSLLPFVILLSAFASQRVDDDISLRLGLDRKAAGIMDHLFTAAPTPAPCTGKRTMAVVRALRRVDAPGGRAAPSRCPFPAPWVIEVTVWRWLILGP